MGTYIRAEQRRAERQYVYYEYFRISNTLANGWDPTAPWCKYWITGENGVSRRDIFNEAIVDHDQYKSNNWQSLEIAFNNLHFPVSKQTREYFRSIATINVRDNLNCKLAIYAGAHINFPAISQDISRCKNDNELSDVLRRLNEQVNVAAINGAFAKLYNVVNEISKNPATDFTQINQETEALLTNYYNALMFGTKTSPALNIPEEPVNFDLPKLLYEKALDLEKTKRGLTPAQIKAELEPILKKLINATKEKHNNSTSGRTK